MRKRENWLFVFAVIGALGAASKILEYFGIRPFSGDAAVPSPPHEGLIWAIALVIFSLGLSGYGLYRNVRLRRDHERAEAAILELLWAKWASLADVYERLDYDNRTNNSTRH